MVRYMKDGADFDFGSAGFTRRSQEAPRQAASTVKGKDTKRISAESYGLVNGHSDMGPTKVVKTPNSAWIKPGPKSERLHRAGGGAIPGPSPAAGMQPLSRTPTENPMANATVSMPAQDLGNLTGKAIKVGAKLGSLQEAAIHAKGRHANPGPGILASPAAQPPPGVPAQPMRKGGRVKKGNY